MAASVILFSMHAWTIGLIADLNLVAGLEKSAGLVFETLKSSRPQCVFVTRQFRSKSSFDSGCALPPPGH